MLVGTQPGGTGGSHSRWLQEEGSHEATGLCRQWGAGVSTSPGQHKSVGLLGGTPPAVGQHRSWPGWETLERGRMLLHSFKAEFKFTTPDTSPEVCGSHGSGDGAGHGSLCHCAHSSLCKREGEVEHPCPHGTGVGTPLLAAGMVSSQVAPQWGQGSLGTHSVAGPEELTTRTRSCWRGARELAAGPGARKKQKEALKQAQPKGSSLGRGCLWRPPRSMAAMVGGQQGKPIVTQPNPADPVRRASGVCHTQWCKF